MSNQVVQTVKSIDSLIDSLPGIEAKEDDQIETLKKLQEDSDRVGEQMRAKVKQAGTRL